jgi:hypothetical protein
MTPIALLAAYLQEAFTNRARVRFLQRDAETARICDELPAETVPNVDHAWAVADHLRMQGLVDARLFARLIQDNPGRQHALAPVIDAWSVSPADVAAARAALPPAGSSSDPSAPASLAQAARVAAGLIDRASGPAAGLLRAAARAGAGAVHAAAVPVAQGLEGAVSAPRDVTLPPLQLLFFSSQPDELQRLRSDRELRDIDERMKDRGVPVWPELAVQSIRLPEILERRPYTHIHYSGHCSPAGGLLLEHANGRQVEVSASSLAEVLAEHEGRLRLVVLNGCYTLAAARHLVDAGGVPFAIGMNDEITDEAAIAFGVELWRRLALRQPLSRAFAGARTQIGLAGMDAEKGIPELVCAEGMDPSTEALPAP